MLMDGALFRGYTHQHLCNSLARVRDDLLTTFRLRYGLCLRGLHKTYWAMPLLNWLLPFSAGAIEWVHAVAKGCVFGVILALRGLACHIDSLWVQSSGSMRSYRTALLGSLLYSAAWRATSTGPGEAACDWPGVPSGRCATVTGCVTCGVAWWCHAGLACQYR